MVSKCWLTCPSAFLLLMHEAFDVSCLVSFCIAVVLITNNVY